MSPEVRLRGRHRTCRCRSRGTPGGGRRYGQRQVLRAMRMPCAFVIKGMHIMPADPAFTKNRSKKKKKMCKIIYSEAGLPVFGQAVPAVNRPALGRLERDFALFATVRTDCLCHFSGTEISRAAKSFSFHWYYSCSLYLHIFISPLSINTSASRRPVLPPFAPGMLRDDLAAVELLVGKVRGGYPPVTDKVPDPGQRG